MSEPQTTLPVAPHFSPKEQFLQLEETAKGWRNFARHDTTATALTYALAEYAHDNPPGDRLAGVRDFIEVLMNLAEPKPQPRAPFPERRLTPPTENSPTQKSK